MLRIGSRLIHGSSPQLIKAGARIILILQMKTWGLNRSNYSIQAHTAPRRQNRNSDCRAPAVSYPTPKKEIGNGVDMNTGSLHVAHNEFAAGKRFILSHGAQQQIIFQIPFRSLPREIGVPPGDFENADDTYLCWCFRIKMASPEPAPLPPHLTLSLQAASLSFASAPFFFLLPLWRCIRSQVQLNPTARCIIHFYALMMW